MSPRMNGRREYTYAYGKGRTPLFRRLIKGVAHPPPLPRTGTTTHNVSQPQYSAAARCYTQRQRNNLETRKQRVCLLGGSPLDRHSVWLVRLHSMGSAFAYFVLGLIRPQDAWFLALRAFCGNARACMARPVRPEGTLLKVDGWHDKYSQPSGGLHRCRTQLQVD